MYLDTGDMTPIEETAQLHLREAKIVVNKNVLTDDGIILIDDVRSCVPKEAGETSDYGKAKYSITEMRCYKPTSDSYNPSNPASLNILNSSFVLELKIGLFDPAGDELESYLVDRYVFNPYIYSTTS